jgi:hypothetical protein
MVRKLQMIAVGLAAALTVAGCGATHRRADPNDPGLVKANHLGGEEIRAAVNDMAKKIAEKNAAGWPAHIPMSSDNPPKPQLRIADIVNDTRLHVNVMDLKNDLMNMMVEQNVVYVVGYADGPGSDRDDVMKEREYAASGIVDANQAAQTPELGGEDVSGLLLKGEISDDVIEVDGVKQHDYWFSLRLLDTRKGRVVLTTRTALRKMKE